MNIDYIYQFHQLLLFIIIFLLFGGGGGGRGGGGEGGSDHNRSALLVYYLSIQGMLGVFLEVMSDSATIQAAKKLPI